MIPARPGLLARFNDPDDDRRVFAFDAQHRPLVMGPNLTLQAAEDLPGFRSVDEVPPVSGPEFIALIPGGDYWAAGTGKGGQQQYTRVLGWALRADGGVVALTLNAGDIQPIDPAATPTQFHHNDDHPPTRYVRYDQRANAAFCRILPDDGHHIRCVEVGPGVIVEVNDDGDAIAVELYSVRGWWGRYYPDGTDDPNADTVSPRKSANSD